MTSSDFILRARDLVAHASGAQFINVQPVWFGYVLGNMKSILCVPGSPDEEIYEVTYNRAKGEMYVDQYEKKANTMLTLSDLASM